MKKVKGAAIGLIVFYFAVPIAAGAQDQAAGVQLGSGYLFPGLDLKFQHDDNLLNAATNELDTFATIISPNFVYEAKADNITRFVADWKLEAGWYEDSSDDDYVDNFLGGLFEYQPTDRFYGAVSVNYIDSRDPRGTGRAEGVATALQADPDEWHSIGMEGNLAYGAETAMFRLEGDVGQVAKEYDNNRTFTFVRDRDDTYGAGRLFYRIAPKTRFVLEGRIVNYEYDQDAPNSATLNSDVLHILGGVTWEATYKTTGFIKIGYIDKDFESNLRTDGDDISWEVGVEWRPRTYSIVNFATSRDYLETNGAGNFIQHDSFTGDWTHSWSDRVSTVAYFSYAEDSFDPTTREDELTNAGVSVNYQMRRWATIGAGYRYDERDSNDNAFDYERNIFEITIRLTL